jgi:pectinesterase
MAFTRTTTMTLAVWLAATASASAQDTRAGQTSVPDRRSAPVEIVVAQDGTGRFTTVQEAVMAVPAGTAASPVIIRIKPGTYREVIYVQREKRHFRFIGEDPEKTVITFNLHANLIGHDGKPIGTFRTPTVLIDADDFVAENLTFENSAGPVGQALAIRVDGDRAIFRNCRFLGWQDTILLNRGRQYFSKCYITGHVDFIFGGATAGFADCRIHVLRDGYITAASTPADERFGFVFIRAEITGAPGAKTYLGRPWRAFSAVTFIDSRMTAVVRPEGWHNWDRPEREQTARYAEAGSTGEGATGAARVRWARTLTRAEAAATTARSVLAARDHWDPARP